MELGERMQRHTKLTASHKLEIRDTTTMREVHHRRPEREEDEFWEEGEPDVEFVPTIQAYVDGELCAELWMQRGEAHSEHELEVAKVETYKYPKHGLATVLWAVAKQNYSVGHSPFQTEAGELWAEHVDAVVDDAGNIESRLPDHVREQLRPDRPSTNTGIGW